MIGNRYEYDAMARCERDLWWYKNLHELTIRTIKKYSQAADPAILDAGCGTGGLIEKLKQEGYTNIKGFDLSPDAVEYSRKSWPHVQMLDILQTDKAFPPNSFDVVVCNDIFTVLPDGKDVQALEKLVGVLKPGGILIINLAALKSFAGSHDVAVSMTRRYAKKSVQQLVSNLVTIKETIFWPFLLSPLIFGIRSFQRLKLSIGKKENLKSDVRPIPSMLNRLFHSVTGFERRLPFAKPWGSSLFVVMQKPQP
jgi:SAM-dependent methyltransferase